MQHADKNIARPVTGRALRLLAAALVGVVALAQPNLAHAQRGGGGGHGGGFGGGGFHGGGGGGFHGGGGGFGGGGFRSGGFHGGGFRGGRFGDALLGGGLLGGFYGGGWGDGLGWSYDSGGYGSDDPLYYNQATAPQYWYYCASPAGYYPYVGQCSVGWQPVPAG